MIKSVSFAICCVLLARAALAQAPETGHTLEKSATGEPATTTVTQDPSKPATPVESEIQAAPAKADPLKKVPAKKESSPKSQTMDRLELDRTAITGNRELPKVLYIVPWKKSDLGNLAGRPTNTLLDEVLAPVDREVFRRQTDYFAKLDAQAEKKPGSSIENPLENPVENQAAGKAGAIESK